MSMATEWGGHIKGLITYRLEFKLGKVQGVGWIILKLFVLNDWYKIRLCSVTWLRIIKFSLEGNNYEWIWNIIPLVHILPHFPKES